MTDEEHINGVSPKKCGRHPQWEAVALLRVDCEIIAPLPPGTSASVLPALHVPACIDCLRIWGRRMMNHPEEIRDGLLGAHHCQHSNPAKRAESDAGTERWCMQCGAFGTLTRGPDGDSYDWSLPTGVPEP